MDWVLDAAGCVLRSERRDSGWIAASGVGPEGFEPSFPDPKSGVLPLDEGPAIMSQKNIASPQIWWERPDGQIRQDDLRWRELRVSSELLPAASGAVSEQRQHT